MGVVSYVGMVGIVLVIGFAIPRFEPAVVEHLSRQVELDRTKGTGLFLVAILWSFLPLLGGAQAGRGELWVAGSAVAGGGFYLVAVAASSLDEHRLLHRATDQTPEGVTAGTGDDVVAISGVPSFENEDDATTPFSGVPSVHTEWIVQRRRRIGFRKTWNAIASGVAHVPFTLGGGAVRVDAGRAWAFTDAELHRTVDPDEDLPVGRTKRSSGSTRRCRTPTTGKSRSPSWSSSSPPMSTSPSSGRPGRATNQGKWSSTRRRRTTCSARTPTTPTATAPMPTPS